MITQAIRGAISLNNDSPEEMISGVQRLMESLMENNPITIKNIISIEFTQTLDLQQMNPAAALRKGTNKYSSVPLFVSQEPEVIGSMGKVVRVLVYCQFVFRKKVKPQYLGETAKLRPDLVS
ncbi:MAG: chorismate mutase [Spirochaetaceae bacterium]|jgi:chorismate mutase|nr:chorismate mutase [Spirochaetaceae bacterium]